MQQPFDLIVRGGVVVAGAGMTRADVGVQGESIAAVEPDLPGENARRVIDASGKLVLPGVIDVHSHPVYVDDIHDTSVSAAFGGTTTSIFYAYARPGMQVPDTIRKFRDDGLQNSVTDFGLHAGLFDVANQIEGIPEAFKLGVTSFKMFMTYAKLKWMTDDYWMTAAMDVIGQEGGLAMLHAENGLATDYLQDKYNRLQVPALEAFTRTAPDVLEAEAINRVIAIAEVMDCPVYIPHVSAERGLEPIRRARQAGRVVYAETCPQYLTLTGEALLGWGPQAKIGPPLRTRRDNDALWDAIRAGIVDTVASDHAPKEKKRDDDFFQAPFGSPQAETLLTVTYDAGVNKGRASLPRIVQLLSETPARIFGYYPRKGVIAAGSDADLVIFDPAADHVIQSAAQHSRAGYTLYEGRRCLGRPDLVMQRGRVIVEGDRLVATAGRAQFLPTRVATRGL